VLAHCTGKLPDEQGSCSASKPLHPSRARPSKCGCAESAAVAAPVSPASGGEKILHSALLLPAAIGSSTPSPKTTRHFGGGSCSAAACRTSALDTPTSRSGSTQSRQSQGSRRSLLRGMTAGDCGAAVAEPQRADDLERNPERIGDARDTALSEQAHSQCGAVLHLLLLMANCTFGERCTESLPMPIGGQDGGC